MTNVVSFHSHSKFSQEAYNNNSRKWYDDMLKEMPEFEKKQMMEYGSELAKSLKGKDINTLFD